MFDGFLKQSTQVTVEIVMISTTDHIAGKTGLSAGLTIYASKAGGAAGAITPTVAEIDNTNMPGVYSLVLTTAHTNTVGDLMLHITGSGADPANYRFQVTAALLDDLSGRLPAALSSGNMKCDLLAINTDATSAANVAKTTRAIGRGTASATGATTTSIPTSAVAPTGIAADQFKNRIITFDADTTTTQLRGQACQITGNTAASAPTFTVTTLTVAPATGDTFSIT